MKKTLAFATLALAALLTPALHATPTRILTVDNMNQVVPDDWDATTYYTLSPHFKNHWYADSYANGKSFGWAFMDVNIGTLVLWYNKDFEGDPIYDLAVAKGGALGLNNTALSTDLLNSVEPREYRIQDPDTKLGLGFAYELLDSLNIGVCFRLAQQNNNKDQDWQNGTGGAISLGNSSAYYMNTSYTPAVMGGVFANVSQVGSVKNMQADNAILVSPQFSYAGNSVTLDFKFDMFWPTVDNEHSENVFEAGVPADGGSVKQTLKDKGRMNYFIRPKLRYMFDGSSSLMLRASYGHLDLSTDHRVSGQFSGTYGGALSNDYDFVDSSQDLGVDQIDSFLGLVKTWDKGKDLITWGLGFTRQALKSTGTVNQLHNGASTYNDVIPGSVSELTDTQWAVPVMVGSEISLSSWCKARAVVQRNFFTSDDTKSVASTYNSDGTLTSVKTTETSTDFGKNWAFNSGFGLNFGSFSWDTALNLSFLSSPYETPISNPLYQSSFTYEF